MKSIVLCADDYGQEEAISRGILTLAAENRLSAISCMVNKDCWQEHANWLLPFKNRLDIGLHFNLTEGKPLTNLYGDRSKQFRSLPATLLQSHLGRFRVETVQKELHEQVERFKICFGSPPQFIDGHQHVHQFPNIREAIIRYYQEHLDPSTYVRWVKLHFSWRRWEWKKWIIHLSGTPALGTLLRHNKIPHNQTFSGCYDFKYANNYAYFFKQFLTEIDDRGLVMCHPGYGDSQLQLMDKARKRELEFLSSQKFLEICDQLKVRLTRFNARLGA